MFRVTHSNSSNFPYLAVLIIGVISATWANYLWYEIPVIKGQSSAIVLLYVAFFVTVVLWIKFGVRRRASWPLTTFLLLMGGAWLMKLVLYRYHGDAFNYTALLYVPTLLLLWLKPPTREEAWRAVLTFAWGVSVVLVATRVLEMAGVIAIKSQPQALIEWDSERYFLPLNDLLGIDGRWPGPFGHNGDTAMMGALLVVLALARWSRSSWFFLFVGGATLLLTNGRASLGAAVAGLVLMAMFTRSKPWALVPSWLRVALGGCVLGASAIIMFSRPTGLTGRDEIWPAFLELWRESPWVGAGGEGIASGGAIVQKFGHAHSLYIDELARWGLAGFVTQFAAIGLGLAIAARAAGSGCPGPLAVILTYLITGITEPRNNWISPSAPALLFILMVTLATTYLSQGPRAISQRQTQDRLDLLR